MDGGIVLSPVSFLRADAFGRRTDIILSDAVERGGTAGVGFCPAAGDVCAEPGETSCHDVASGRIGFPAEGGTGEGDGRIEPGVAFRSVESLFLLAGGHRPRHGSGAAHELGFCAKNASTTV